MQIIKNTKLNIIFGSDFELIHNGFNSGVFNMKFDMDRTERVASGEALPMFRLYGWKPWAVSLGAHQKQDDINIEECHRRNYDLVSRPTGGRAVLHANELTYSLVMNLQDGQTVQDVYRDIHIILLNALKNLGTKDLDFEKSQPNFREFYKDSGMSVSCFASSARYEIAYKERKVIGSAQRLFGKTLLQHGSILLGKGHEQLAFITKTANSEAQMILLNYIESHSATVEEAAGRNITFEEAANSVINTITND